MGSTLKFTSSVCVTPLLTRLVSVTAGAVAVALLLAPSAAHASACEDLRRLELPGLRIVAADDVAPSPTWTTPPTFGRPSSVRKAFCRVQAVAEKEVGFELWLPPAADWNRRYLGVGNGGDAGFLRYDILTRGVSRGFAAASSDLGHRQEDAHWALGHPDRLENFGVRGHHLLATNAKRLIARYYGAPQRRSYYVGCSGGGLGGMNEVQRYPADYDGVIAGAAGTSMVGISARWLTDSLMTRADPASALSADQWRAVAQAAVRQCDTLDGLKDGIIADPRRCAFDPGSTPGLTAAQKAHARKVLGPVAGKDGEVLFPALPPGAVFGPLPGADDVPARMFGEWAFQRPDWDATTFDPGRDVTLTEALVPGLRIRNPDLDPFRRLGGKLISYVGWADPIVPAEANIGYFESVRRQLGGPQTDSFARLYLAPGMGHCSGGVGPDVFGQEGVDPPVIDAQHDMLTALVRWVEDGVAPGALIASRVDKGAVVATRPLCAYPAAAAYRGKGDPTRAENFRCVGPRH